MVESGRETGGYGRSKSTRLTGWVSAITSAGSIGKWKPYRF